MSRPLGLEFGPFLPAALPLFAVVATLLLLEPAASAQPHGPGPRPTARRASLADSLPADARRDYDAGKLLFEDGDYATALLKYQAAYDSTKDARLLWDVAVCEKSLRHYARALAALARYLTEGHDVLAAA